MKRYCKRDGWIRLTLCGGKINISTSKAPHPLVQACFATKQRTDRTPKNGLPIRVKRTGRGAQQVVHIEVPTYDSTTGYFKLPKIGQIV